MTKSTERELREKLAILRAEHRELDLQITAQEHASVADQILITRLKKQKLKLKDKISALEDDLLPDIIA